MVDQCSFVGPFGRLIRGGINGGIHIDFYHFHVRGTQLQDDSQGHATFYNKDDFFPLKKCQFMGIWTLCPRNPWLLLQKYYRSNKIAESPYGCMDGKWVKRQIWTLLFIELQIVFVQQSLTDWLAVWHSPTHSLVRFYGIYFQNLPTRARPFPTNSDTS